MWFRKKKPAQEIKEPSNGVTVARPQLLKGDVQRMNTWVRGSFERSFRPVRQTRSSFWIVLGYTALLLATQLTLAYANKAGLFLNVVTLLVLTAGALLRDDLRKLSVSLAILPVVQMAASSFMPNSAFQKATIVYGLLLVLTFIYRYLFTLDAPVAHSQLKFRGHAFGVPLMLILGEVVGVLGYVFLRHHYPYAEISLPLVGLAVVVFAFAEEMFLRGLVQKQAGDIVHPWVAVVLTSVLYACLAFDSTTLLSVGPAIAMGVVLALVYRFKHNLLLSITINAAAKLTYIGLVATFILR